MSVVVDVEQALDSNRLRGRPLTLFVLLSLVLAADGFDLLVLGFVAPAIGREFALSPVGIGWLTTFSHAGVACGGILGGVYGDRLGRRPVLLSGVVLFGVCGLLGASAHQVVGFAVLRFAGSIGLGAVTPNVAAYLTEILPRHWRSRLTILTYTVSTLGATVCGLAARAIFPAAGWRILFVFGGIAPLLLLPWIGALLPESPRFLLGRPGGNLELAKALAALTGARQFDGSERFMSTATPAQQTAARSLFGSEYVRDTVSLWILSFGVMFSSIAMTSMSTVILTAARIPLRSAVMALLAFNILGVVGGFSAAAVITRLGSRMTLSVLVSIGVAGLIALGTLLHQGATVTGVTIAMAVCGFGLSGSWMMTYPVLAQAYPASIRSTGVGAALTFGRIGSVLSAIVVAGILTLGGPAPVPFALAGVAALVWVGLAGLHRHIAPVARARASE